MEYTEKENRNEIVCSGCGSSLKFEPGTDSLKCQHCGTMNQIAVSNEIIEEIDFVDFLKNQTDIAPKITVNTISCDACGATTTFDENVVSSECDFCATPLVAKSGTQSNILEPKSLLPFRVNEKETKDLFAEWLKSLWFAPNKLKTYAKGGKINGIYIPYWTYDANTNTTYRGERGDDYEVKESYEEDGETKTRTVTKTRWRDVSGKVSDVFDDVLVVASKSLPSKLQDELEPWDLDQLVPYNSKYVTGFKTESYKVGLEEGYEVAQGKMETEIEKTIKKEIGGDHQRISAKDIKYFEIMFKHILLPIWISAYKYNSKTFRFIVNGRTGEVQGERPYSWIKITFAVLLVLLIIFLVVYFSKNA